MHIGRFIRVAVGIAILSVFAVPALAGVYQGPGYYVAVSILYDVEGRLQSYHGPIEGPFATKAACIARVEELEAIEKTRDPSEGHAFIMCYKLDAPMKDDSGIWRNPRPSE
jgi:hypothetical protein